MDSMMMTTDEWYYASRVLKSAVGLFAAAFVLVTVAFSTPYWLQSTPSEQIPEPMFVNTGLWVSCLNNYHDRNHQYDYRFNGCKYILYEEYDIIRDEIQPSKLTMRSNINSYGLKNGMKWAGYLLVQVIFRRFAKKRCFDEALKVYYLV